jgi:hypothetical protein
MNAGAPAIIDNRTGLAQITSFNDVKSIRALAIGWEVRAKEAQDRERLDRAIEIRLLAEIRAGEMLLSLGERRGGDQTSEERSLPSNEELGITDKQSSRWQQLATLSHKEQATIIAEAKDKVAAALAREKRGNGTDKAKTSPLVRAWNKANEKQRQQFFDEIEPTFLRSLTDTQRRRIFAKLSGGHDLPAAPGRVAPTQRPNGRTHGDINRDIGALE